MTIDLKDLKLADVQNYLQHAIAPRPICFASTIDAKGNVNLSPFSFFNLFSSNPPIVIFSPSRRVRDNTTKHTLQNILEVPEVVINIVDFPMVQQVSLASCEFPKNINEFTKAGFTEEAATLIKPPMVLESKIKLECTVSEVKVLGDKSGAGNLVICEVLRMHIDNSILDGNKKIDQTKIHHVARLGGDWYCKADGVSLFKVEKPNQQIGIGIDALPEHIRMSTVLSGNDLGQLGNVHELPVIDPAFEDDALKKIFQYHSGYANELEKELHTYAKALLKLGQAEKAWQVLIGFHG